MGMKQILVMMAVLSSSVMADEFVFKDPELSALFAEHFEKPSGKFAPKPTFSQKELEKITHINWTSRDVSDDFFADLVRLPNLTELRLNKAKKLGDKHYKQISKLQNLVWLDLSRTGITADGLVEVAKLQKLQWLFLSDTWVGDKGMKEVAKLQNLEKLYLDDTKITDEGLKEVAKLQKLKSLDLWNCKITDDSFFSLAKLKNLKYLNLKDYVNGGYDRQDVRELESAMPKCEIYHMVHTINPRLGTP